MSKVEYKDTADDVSKKWSHSYCKYGGEVVYVHSIGGDNTAPDDPYEMTAYFITNGETKPTFVKEIKAELFEALVFDAAFVNSGENPQKNVLATHYSRSPKRQWKRGLTKENTRITCPLAPLYRSFGKHSVPRWTGSLDFDLIGRLQNPVYPTWDEAMDMVGHTFAVAVNPMFAITVSNQSDSRRLLASSFGFIGECDRSVIYVRHKPVLQEVRDFVSRSKQNLTVEFVNA